MSDKRLPAELITSIVREIPPEDAETLRALHSVAPLQADVEAICLHTIELACSLSAPWIDQRRAHLPYRSYLQWISNDGVGDIVDVLLREKGLRRHVRKLFLGWPNNIAVDGKTPAWGDGLTGGGPKSRSHELLPLLTRLQAVDFVAEGPRRDTARPSMAAVLVQVVATHWPDLRCVGLTGWKVTADEGRTMLKAIGEAIKLEEICLTECICDGAVMTRPADLDEGARPYVLIMNCCDFALRLAGLVCAALGQPTRMVYRPPVRRVAGAPGWGFEVGNISEMVGELSVEVNVDRCGEWGLDPPNMDIVLDMNLRKFDIHVLSTQQGDGVETNLWQWLSALAGYLYSPDGCAAAIKVSAQGSFSAMAAWSALASRREGIIIFTEDHIAVEGLGTGATTDRVSERTTNPTTRVRTFELLGYDSGADRTAVENRLRALRHRLRGVSASDVDLPGLISSCVGRADYLEFLAAYAADEDSDGESTIAGKDGGMSPAQTRESDDGAQAWEDFGWRVDQLPSKVRHLRVSLESWRIIWTGSWASLVVLALHMEVPETRGLPLPPLPQLRVLSLHLPVKPRRSLGTYACHVYPQLIGLAIGGSEPARSTLEVICGKVGGRMRSLMEKFDRRWVFADWAGLHMNNLRVVLWRGMMLVREPDVGWGGEKAFKLKNRRLRDWEEGGERVAEYSSYGIADVCEVLGL